jgi:hypothetical protein
MKIEKFNEFVSSEIYALIEKAENTPLSDPIAISQRDSYKKLVSMGDKVLPYILERKSYLWNIALKQLTGVEPTGDKSSEIMDFWEKWSIENGYKK